MALLAIQFGLQPLFQKACIDKHQVNKTSLVMATEVVKALLCLIVMRLQGSRSCRAVLSGWTLSESLAAAAFPAACYSAQNWLAQTAYMHLDSLTYNLLNQTKTLSAAVCTYLVMGRRQSGPQVAALLLLLAAAMLLNLPSGSGRGDTGSTASGKAARAAAAAPKRLDFEMGVLPVLGASFLSGFSGAVTQRTLQSHNRSSYLLSLELAIYGCLAMALSLPGSADGARMGREGFFAGWTPLTALPVITQAAGGVVVGQVTKHAGSVRKGFALIAGILITALVQSFMEQEPLSASHYGAALLTALGTYLHASYPYRLPIDVASEKVD
ncbi:unnamed protein product [Phaeothamnion confervicola]